MIINIIILNIIVIINASVVIFLIVQFNIIIKFMLSWEDMFEVSSADDVVREER